DDPRWHAFPFSSFDMFGTDEFTAVLQDFERKQTSSTLIDSQSSSRSQILRYLSLFTPCNANSSWRCPMDHQLKYVVVSAPDETKLFGNLVDPYKGDAVLYQFVITVHATADTARPWVITNARIREEASSEK